MARPRALLVFAHPDDEVIALGGRMARFGDSHFVHVTDGAPRNATTERYRIAPKYDFCAPAHNPPVLYDHYPWGMNSARFAELAREAECELGTASARDPRIPQPIQQESKR